MPEDLNEKTKRLLFAGVGSLAGAMERFEDTIEELAELGELRTKNSEGFIREILDRVKAEREEFNVIVLDILQDAFNTLGIATRSDVEGIQERLNYLNRKVSRMDGAKKTAKKKKKAKKRGKS